MTQVVHVGEGHVFHNRLTHTLKVGQVARRIAEYLLDPKRNKPIEERQSVDPGEVNRSIDPDVVETAALVHDLGHPPFGHIAEEELDAQLQVRNINDGYEGNAQSFRIVTKLELRDSSYPGLNLTRATLNASLKYPWKREITDEEKSRKWNYYHSELDDFRFARELGPSGPNKSIEAAIMDLADDITYSVHDVEDFYRAGFIPLHVLIAGPASSKRRTERDRFLDDVYSRWEAKKDVANLGNLDRDQAERFFEDLEAYCGDLGTAYSGSRAQEVVLSNLTSFLISRYIVGFGDEVAISLVKESDRLSLQRDARFKAEIKLLKALMPYYVYHSPALIAQQFGQRHIIRELFSIYFDAVRPLSPNRHILPVRFQDYCSQIDSNIVEGAPDLERARMAADVIASMTEQQAMLMYHRLMGINPGSVRDPIVR